MPVYEFFCPACRMRYEELVRSYDATAPCPSCGRTRVERLFSSFSIGGLGPSPGAGGSGGGCHGGG